MGGSGSKATKSLCSNLKGCTLWKADRSPACRAVMMTLDAMELSTLEVDVNLDHFEHRKPELTALNPYQTLPIFRDKDMVLYDSHAICAYLASRYSNNESSNRIYPLDPGGRAQVHQMMCYNCGVLYPRYRAAADPILYEDCKFVMPQQVCDIECAYADLEILLRGREWFGGSWPTLADITIGATLSTLNALVPVDYHRYPRLFSWLSRLSDQLFYTTANKKGLQEFIVRIGELSVIKVNQ